MRSIYETPLDNDFDKMVSIHMEVDRNEIRGIWLEKVPQIVYQTLEGMQIQRKMFSSILFKLSISSLDLAPFRMCKSMITTSIVLTTLH